MRTWNEQLSIAERYQYALANRSIVPVGMLNDSNHQRPDCMHSAV